MTTINDIVSLPVPDCIDTGNASASGVSAREILNRVRREHIPYSPSPMDWQDEILYFLLPDRFNDGKAHTRQLLTRQEIANLRSGVSRPNWNWHNWAESGKRWQGGTIEGIKQKLTYIKELGVTAIWVGPIFKQRPRLDTYHGYGIQDFLEVDPRFGTRQDLLDLVQAAHQENLRIILDIIVNHSGDNWGYLKTGNPPSNCLNEPAYCNWPDFYGNPSSSATSGWCLAWRDENQQGFASDPAAIANRNQAVWPRELQDPARYTRAGKGNLGAGDKENDHAEFRRTDFCSMKDMALDVPPTLDFLADCYKYWIAVSDIDGYRVDTVKHMELESARKFCGAIREFAETLGKRNFFLISEIAGGDDYQDFYLDHLLITRRNMTAALDIGGARTTLTGVGKGLQPGGNYLDGFKPDEGFGSHRNDGSRHISILDDHDHVFGEKVRFSAEIPDGSPVKDYQVSAPTAIQLFTLGIPCIYYGTEQAFAGPAQSEIQWVRSEGWKNGSDSGDRYLREAMFGPDHPRAHHSQSLVNQVNSLDPSLPGFGAFGTCGKHCFDNSSPAFVRISALCKTRKAHTVLRVGRQYPRELRLPGTGFVFPGQGEIVAWSRVLDTLEALCIVNSNGTSLRGGDVVVSAEISPPGSIFEVVANTAHAAAGSAYNGSHPVGSTLKVIGKSTPQEPAFVEIRNIPPSEALVLVRRI
ncbi:MAG: alpha-amylase family glycosyl hydrolase [Syntrophobacter sp.]